MYAATDASVLIAGQPTDRNPSSTFGITNFLHMSISLPLAVNVQPILWNAAAATLQTRTAGRIFSRTTLVPAGMSSNDP